jgi:hypothetical protein
MAPKSKSKIKPSVQTQFVLDAMVAEEQKMKKRLDKMHESIDLICSKLEAHDVAQLVDEPHRTRNHAVHG